MHMHIMLPKKAKIVVVAVKPGVVNQLINAILSLNKKSENFPK